MMQSITTRYLGPTNAHGSRIKAIARKRGHLSGWPEQSLTDPYSYEGNNDQEHCRVAQLLAVKLKWHGIWIGGGSLDEDGYVFVCIPVTACDNRTKLGLEGADWFYVPMVP